MFPSMSKSRPRACSSKRNGYILFGLYVVDSKICRKILHLKKKKKNNLNVDPRSRASLDCIAFIEKKQQQTSRQK